MDRIKEVKEILEHNTISWYRDDKEAWVEVVAKLICQRFESTIGGKTDRLLDIDQYLDKMGWIISKDGLQYAWLKQALETQRDLTASIKDTEITEIIRQADLNLDATVTNMETECQERIRKAIGEEIEEELIGR